MTTLFTSQLATVGYARVAVQRGVDRYPDGLTYAVPGELGDLAVGEPVIVPRGAGDTPNAGSVIERFNETARAPGRIKPDDGRANRPQIPDQL